MGEYIVSARKYRPMTFDSVVGQSALTDTLKNAVKSGKLAHAYLFCGPRGVGKTTCARIFAKTINCEHPREDGEACNECESCKAFNENRSLNIFELDAASHNGVEDIKDLMEQTRTPPVSGRYKVFIIDEVHMLSKPAFNAFLKTLEEPPAHVVFILATTEKQKILPTILSRCQIFDFERMTIPNTIAHLKMVAEKEGIKYEEPALEVIAEKADGGMRDALSIFDQVTSFTQGNITYDKTIEDLNVLDADNYFKIVDLSTANKVSEIMVLLNNILSKGFDGQNLILGLAAHIRNVMMARDTSTLPLLECSERMKKQYAEQAARCSNTFLYTALKILNRCDQEYRQSNNKRLLVELTLIEVAQITQPADSDTPGAGRQPHRLKILFKTINVSGKKGAPQVAAAGQRQAAAGTAAQTKQAAQPQQQKPVAAPASSAVSTASAAAPAARPATAGMGNIGFSFKNILSAASKKDTAADYAAAGNNGGQTNNETFTQEQLVKEWTAMCNRMPKEYVGLAQRLKNITPAITDFPNVDLAVNNELFLNEVARIQRRITATMRMALHNDNIQFTVRLAKSSEITRILTKPELFEQMKEKNPAIKRLSDELGLVLT